MSTGYITVKVFTADKAMPVQKAQIRIVDLRIALDQTIYTDSYGNAERIKVYAPEKETSLKPQEISLPYETYNIEVVKDGYIPTIINNVQVFPGETSLLPVAMIPQPEGDKYASLVNNFEIPPNGLLLKTERIVEKGPATYNPLQTKPVYIPDVIRVHLGDAGSEDKTVLVLFSDYVKNVASSEIYATWPKEALEANIYAIISFALNRIYTGYYPSKGYDYDVTSMPDHDPYYVDGRNIFANINELVDGIFNKYIKRIGFNEPLLANYCNGITIRCEGLSQWGSVTLANQGQSAEEILKYYYGNIKTEETHEIRGVQKNFPGTLLRLGDVGENVMAIQKQLNQINKTYNNIPDIPKENGNFDAYTQDAVRAFQKQFNLPADGIVGKKTWYQIAFIYNAVQRLSAISQTRQSITIPAAAPSETLREGSNGSNVRLLQYLLQMASIFYNSVLPVEINGTFGQTTTNSVKSFQKTFTLPQTGVVDAATWNALLSVNKGIEDQVGPVLDHLAGQAGRQAQPVRTGRPAATQTGPTQATQPGSAGQKSAARPGRPDLRGTDQERISAAMSYANRDYSAAPIPRGSINTAYSSDIMDYVPDTYSNKADIYSAAQTPWAITPGIDQTPPVRPGGGVSRSATGPTVHTNGQTGATAPQTSIPKPGAQMPGPQDYPYMPWMKDRAGAIRPDTNMPHTGGEQTHMYNNTDDQKGRAETGIPYTRGDQTQMRDATKGQTGITRPGESVTQPGSGAYSYTPWMAAEDQTGLGPGNIPQFTGQTYPYSPWITDDQTGSWTTESAPKPTGQTAPMRGVGIRPETMSTKPGEPAGVGPGVTSVFEMQNEFQTGPTLPQYRSGMGGIQRIQPAIPARPGTPSLQVRTQPGTMPPGTVGALPDEDDSHEAYECPAPPIANPVYPKTVLKIGSKGKNVQLMQEYLSYIALSLMRYNRITDELKVIVNDGIYGIDTTDAVIRFQNRYEMPVNGIIDQPTWFKIVEVYNNPCD